MLIGIICCSLWLGGMVLGLIITQVMVNKELLDNSIDTYADTINEADCWRFSSIIWPVFLLCLILKILIYKPIYYLCSKIIDKATYFTK